MHKDEVPFSEKIHVERFFMEVHQNFVQPWTMILQRKRSLAIKT